MEKQKNNTKEKSLPQEKVNPQAQDILYLTGDIKSGQVVNKKVIIKEQISLRSSLSFDNCELIFAVDTETKKSGSLQIQNSNLEIKGGKIHCEQEFKGASPLFQLNEAQIMIDGTKILSSVRFIDTDAASTVKIENSDIEDVSPSFVVQSVLTGNENLTLHIKNSNFQQNSSIKDIEPLFNISHISQFTIEKSTFKNLSFPVLNIRLYSTVRQIELSSTTFLNCRPEVNLLKVSGGFGTKLLIADCEFSKCSALYFADDPIEIKNCTFDECYAVTKEYSGGIIEQAQGGAIQFDCYDYGKIETCSFKNCSALIERKGLLAQMTGLKDSKKSLAGDGGAVYIDMNPYHSKSVQINECAFISCRAAEKGGAICVTQEGKTQKPMVHITGCRFVDCEANEGSAVHHLSMVTGEYKWQTKEKPFVSAVITDADYMNCESYPDEKKQNAVAEDNSITSVKEDYSGQAGNVSKIVLTLLGTAETMVKGQTQQEQERIQEEIVALENKMIALETDDPERFKEIEQKMEELEMKSETLDTFEEIKTEARELIGTLVSDFHDIFK